MIQYIADAEPTATHAPAYTAILTLPTDTVTINAYSETSLVTVTYAYTDGGRVIREIPAGRGYDSLRIAFQRELEAAKALGYTRKGIMPWSCDPWDLISVLDAAPSF